MKRISRILIGGLCLAIACFAQAAPAQEERTKPPQDSLSALERATENAVSKQRFDLKYRFAQDTKLRWEIEHTRATKMHMVGEAQETSTRDRLITQWNFTAVESDGTFQFENMIESMMLWRKVGEDAPIMYDSTQPDKGVPPEFREMQVVVGKVISAIGADSSGKILERRSDYKKTKLGVGEILVPLPSEPVAVGQSWSVPDQFQATDEHGLVQTLSLRVLHRLEKVVDGKAYISIRTEMLTPVESEKVRSQSMQQMSSGYAVFDLARGQVIFKELNWNERVQGFEGNDSLLTYLAKRTERLLPETQSLTVKPAATSSHAVNVEIKPRDGGPILRK